MMRVLSLLGGGIVAIVIASAPYSAWAATVYFKQTPGTGRVGVYLDTAGATINAIEGSLDMKPDMIAAMGFGGSVIPLWVEQPQRDHAAFSGVIPGGYEGSEGKLFDIELTGGVTTRVSVNGAKAYLNDGAGTRADLVVMPLDVHVAEGVTTLTGKDTQAPVFSDVQIARDPALFNGDWFIAFNAHDEQSGIRRYEIAERAGDSVEDVESLHWRAAESPARLEDQMRQSTIFIRAHDGAGNATVTSTLPRAAAMIDPRAVLGGIALILLALGLIVVIRKVRLRP